MKTIKVELTIEQAQILLEAEIDRNAEIKNDLRKAQEVIRAAIRKTWRDER